MKPRNTWFGERNLAIVIFVVVVVVLCISTGVMMVMIDDSANRVISQDTIVDRVVQVVTLYNQGLGQSGRDTGPDVSALARDFWLVFFVVFVILCFASSPEKPINIGSAITLAIVCASIFVLLPLVIRAHAGCGVDAIVDQPYQTGVACGLKGNTPLSLRALLDKRVTPGIDVKSHSEHSEIRRIVARLLTLTVDESLQDKP